MKVAIMGAGAIAKSMAHTILGLKHPEIELYAIASRTQEKAEAFSEEFKIPKAYGTYEAMLCDPSVDLVYIATPHSEHYKNALNCITHKKPMLVEKAFTMNALEARTILDKAAAEKVFITEAIWTRYMPSRRIIDNIIASGTIGMVHSVQANLGYPITHKPRIVDPALAGGALLDLSVYPINFALMVLGDDVTSIQGTCVKGESGVDLMDNIAITFESGALASLHATAYSPTDRMGYIYGETGYLAVTNINNPEKIERFDKDHKFVEDYALPKQITGYEYQLLECLEALKKGELSCPSMPHEKTVQVMELTDKLREQWSITFPTELKA